jgi:hypothetical protein
MRNGINKKQQLDEQRRKKCVQAASAMGCAAKVPPRVIPVPSAAKRASAGLAPHRYPVKRASLGVAPLGRGDK